MRFNMKLILKSKKGTHYAEALYDGNKVIIQKGAKVNPIDSFPKMSEAIKRMRYDRNVVSEEGRLLVDLSFDSPSTAAQFITGRSVNGLIAWRPDDKTSLKAYKQQHE